MIDHTALRKVIEKIFEHKFSITLFFIFFILNINYFFKNFFFFFLNKEYNGDEYYHYNLYTIKGFSIDNFFNTPSQLYIFISSFVDYFLRAPKMSTRLVSLILCIGLIIYFIIKINATKGTLLEKFYKWTLFICAIFITNQMYQGTSDFLSFVLIIFPLMFILENIRDAKINVKSKKAVIIGVLIGLSITVRPTSIVLLMTFYMSLFIIIGYKILLSKNNFIILISIIFVVGAINFIPIIKQNKIILDVKEVPVETGVNWFQRNYLMAKFWDSNTIPRSKWISTQEVIDYKKANPNFIFPKNQLDLLIKEPGLYMRQLYRMVFMAMYSSFRFMYFLFPLLFLSFSNHKNVKLINEKFSEFILRYKVLIFFYFISILFFSILAVKMFEFRWVIPIMIVYTFMALEYLSKFNKTTRFFVYNLCFLSGILLYLKNMFFLV